MEEGRGRFLRVRRTIERLLSQNRLDSQGHDSGRRALLAGLLLDHVDQIGDPAAIGFRRQVLPSREWTQLDRLGLDKFAWLERLSS